ncbi:Tim44 domain-containing protein [Grimontia marina]|uniref:Tim44-like domain protein n=1 Tax=Grimontia marina TaxID=646534 RepID=A0A128ES76_9GAMM|nr:TIM44-like domain-containing protein [Grimontia marina]CZF77413.1 Tim44-like domain protein [Grimontia marina]
MKRFFTLFALMFVMVVSAPHAEAKKFGGGKSFGKSFKTAPAPKSQPTNTNSINKQNDPAAAAKSSSKKGLMGGLLGGLLAGGLIAAMFGGAFEGFQMMDFLIVAIIAFVLFKIFKSMMAAKSGSMNRPNQQAYAGGQEPQNKGYYHEEQQPQFRESAATSSTGGFGAVNTDVPFNFPPNFDMAGFVNGAREHYRILQGAWNHNQLETIQEYVTPELYNDLAEERRKLEGEQHTEVMYVDAEIVRADYDSKRAQLSLQFSGRYTDRQEGVEEDITDIWHLERDMTQANAPWLIVGIQA